MNTAQQLSEMIQERYGRPPAACSTAELYPVLLDFAKMKADAAPRNTGKKKLYYISMEFLVGRLLACNLMNLGVYREVEAFLHGAGSSMAAVEEYEPEPSLGNGGLGRLAACYMDSAATLRLPADGVGLCYHFGLFKQEFEHNKQKAVKNPWIEADSWLEDTGVRFPVSFGETQVEAVMRDIVVPGFHTGANRLHLFDLASVDESVASGDGIAFDKSDVTKNLTLFLYPDDSDEAGRLLRVYQEYFLVSCAAQLLLREAEGRGSNLHDLADYAVVQINDTHPSMVIPELIRLLTERGIELDEAVEIVSHMCAYTNHTILAEALEKWPMEFIGKVAPQIVPILWELDKRAKARHSGPALDIIDENETVHMARLDIHYGYSVNGVAALHTEILEESELAPFYEIYPEKFNNKTNGITFRRWLMAINPELAGCIETHIGPSYKKFAGELEKLMAYQNDEAVLADVLRIKHDNKRKLAEYLAAHECIGVDPDSVFDIQIKRLHEYKRQQLNALWLIKKYLEIKAGKLPKRPITMIFGAKAAPAYVIAQDIIHLILCMQQLVDNDPEVSRYLRVVMVENYNVSAAEVLIPACDISEQISLASKEASGTGNMKFMLNGAVTLGTLDGANVEIADLVGRENIYIFGKSSDEVIDLYAKGSYDPLAFYGTEDIGRLVDFIVSRELVAIGDRMSLARLHRELVAKDYFMTLLDAASYFETKERMLDDYEDRTGWAKKMLANTAKAGFFSSDRAVDEYERHIWHLRAAGAEPAQ